MNRSGTNESVRIDNRDRTGTSTFLGITVDHQGDATLVSAPMLVKRRSPNAR